MEYVKIPTDDMRVITAVIDVFWATAPSQYKESVHEVYNWLHKGKYKIVKE